MVQGSFKNYLQTSRVTRILNGFIILLKKEKQKASERKKIQTDGGEN